MKKTKLTTILLVALLAVMHGGCAPAPDIVSTAIPTGASPEEYLTDLSEEETRTLASLEQVDAYPLYVMHFYATYDLDYSIPAKEVVPHEGEITSNWACSLFASMGDESNMLFGRNFDWEYSPALLLFNHPADGYASVSMVDIAYLGFEAGDLIDLSLAERRGFLYAPLLPFDGMNERGLTIGMAAVPPGDMVPDPEKGTTGSLRVMRLMLDRAASVDEALAILDSYNIDIAGGPPLHYLIADRTGRSVLVEFYQGDMVVVASYETWHQATNFLRAEADGAEAGLCWRYDLIYQRLEQAAGKISAQEAMNLLRDVSQPGTQWSVVYGITTGEILISMGREYGVVNAFMLSSP